MVIDTSAILAILLNEPDRRRFDEAIEADPMRLLAAPAYLETSMVLFGRRGDAGLNRLERMIGLAEIDVAPFTAQHAELARLAARTNGFPRATSVAAWQRARLELARLKAELTERQTEVKSADEALKQASTELKAPAKPATASTPAAPAAPVTPAAAAEAKAARAKRLAALKQDHVGVLGRSERAQFIVTTIRDHLTRAACTHYLDRLDAVSGVIGCTAKWCPRCGARLESPRLE